MKTIAAIDIGTNSALYSLFSIKGRRLIESHFERHSPRIGGRLKGAKRPDISKASYKSLFNILGNIIRHAHRNKAEEVLIVATNPFRLAGNGREIKTRLEKDTRCGVSILTPEREAYLSFIGAIGKLKANQSAAIIDLGGGSTEFVGYRGEKRQIFLSLPEGAVSLTEIFRSDRVVRTEQFSKFSDYLSKYNRRIQKFKPYVEKGITLVGGTSSALAHIKDSDFLNNRKDISLTVSEIELFINLLAPLNVDCRRRLLQADIKRSEIIFGGAFWLNHLFKILDLRKVRVTSRGLRHGVVIDYCGF
jgi:exopolyphosphatase/guanosine-5'-triphosphate,3'-diphosphate pyrophosphatase